MHFQTGVECCIRRFSVLDNIPEIFAEIWGSTSVVFSFLCHVALLLSDFRVRSS